MTDPAGSAGAGVPANDPRPEERKMCEQCSHPFDLHSVVSPGHDPMQGGVILCPVAGCSCYATWGVNGGKPVTPTAEEVTRLRTAVQTGEFQ